MKYIGPAFYEPHVRGDIAEIRRRLAALGHKAPEPRTIRLSEVRSGTRKGGAWAARMAGNWGVSFADADDIWLVTGPRGDLNKAWREDLFHEVAHVVLFTAGIPDTNDAHHRVWFRKMRVPV